MFIPKGQIVEDIIGTDYDTYVVKFGDTLYGIANQYGVNIDDIRNSFKSFCKLIPSSGHLVINNNIANLKEVHMHLFIY